MWPNGFLTCILHTNQNGVLNAILLTLKYTNLKYKFLIQLSTLCMWIWTDTRESYATAPQLSLNINLSPSSTYTWKRRSLTWQMKMKMRAGPSGGLSTSLLRPSVQEGHRECLEFLTSKRDRILISLKCMVVTDYNLTSIAENFPLFKDLSLVFSEGFNTLGLVVDSERCRYCRIEKVKSLF